MPFYFLLFTSQMFYLVCYDIVSDRRRREDAVAYLQVLHRLVKNAAFAIIFDKQVVKN